VLIKSNSTFMCYPLSLWLLSILFIAQTLVSSAIASAASYGEDGFCLSHSQGRLCPSCSFQAFGGYAPARCLLGSQRWLASRLDLVFCLSLPVLLGVNQIQGFKIWDPGEFWVLGIGGSAALVFPVGDLITGGALLKFNLSQIWLFDLGSFNFLFKNKHNLLCKFRLWLYFLFSWVRLELDWIYWSQWQYLLEFFCWLLTAVMHSVCIVLGFESSIRILGLDSSIRPFVWSVLLIFRMPILRIVILY
jgi:hypothetical protein